MKRSRRSNRLEYRRIEAAETKASNRKDKDKERARRDARMIDKIRQGDPPYTPDVMSWLSVKLGKRSSRVTRDDVRALLA